MHLWWLLIGDIAALLVFSLSGQRSHNMAITLGGVLETALPFIIGWIIISILFGLYRKHNYSTFGTMFKRFLLVWVLAIPLGWFLRGLLFGKGYPWVFLIVSLISTFVIFLIWRAIAYQIIKRRGV